MMSATRKVIHKAYIMCSKVGLCSRFGSKSIKHQRNEKAEFAPGIRLTRDTNSLNIFNKNTFDERRDISELLDTSFYIFGLSRDRLRPTISPVPQLRNSVHISYRMHGEDTKYQQINQNDGDKYSARKKTILPKSKKNNKNKTEINADK